MSDSDKPTIGTQEFDLAAWVRAPGTFGRAPHFYSYLDRNDPLNQLRVEWADERRTVPVAVQDIDGCRAVVRGPSKRSVDTMVANGDSSTLSRA